MSPREMPRWGLPRRAPLPRFALWLLPWFLLLAVAGVAIQQCLTEGLFHTNMDNRYAFGLWIFLDLTVIALGAGAFSTGVLVYLLRRRDLAPVLPSAVILGFLCYSGAIAVLLVDVGQPLRAWFTFWHPNVHSMLAEVTFCLTCYLLVLALESTPLVLRHRRLRHVEGPARFGAALHHRMVVLAAVGAFLSFFHQGSLGGLYGVLQGRPFAFREGLLVWPTTFFLFILSAVAAGPSFLVVVSAFARRVTGRKLVPQETLHALARLSARVLLLYLLLKGVDTLVWLNHTAPEAGFHGYWFYRHEAFGTWILFAEMGLLGLLPAALLLRGCRRGDDRCVVGAAALVCLGVALNRFAMTIQTLALPTLAFERSWAYWPSWQETAAFGGVLAYGVILFSLAYRHLPLYPRDRELDRDLGGAPSHPLEESHVSG